MVAELIGVLVHGAVHAVEVLDHAVVLGFDSGEPVNHIHAELVELFFEKRVGHVGCPFGEQMMNLRATARGAGVERAQMETPPSGPNNCVRRVVNVPSDCTEGSAAAVGCACRGELAGEAAAAPPLVPAGGAPDVGEVAGVSIGLAAGRTQEYAVASGSMP